MADANQRDIIKKAATIQKYFNKISITRSSDITGVELPKSSDDIYTAFGGYKTSLDGFTAVDQNRVQRYREYEQMCYVPELNAGLELYADDGSLYNEDDHVVSTMADNQEVVENLDHMWFRTLDMNANLWHIFYNTCKYGDSFYELIPDDYKNPKKIKYMKYIPPHFVSRQEVDGNLIGFLVSLPNEESSGATYSNTEDNDEVFLAPWQMVHFKMDDKEFDPYGKSVMESGRLAFKQMKMIEDAMLIYRLSRAPERRIFNIPVGQLPYREAMARVEDFKAKYRKTPWVDPTTGEINYKANPLCLTFDTPIDLLDGRIETLSTLIKEYNEGKENWTYSIDRENGNKIVPGKIEWAGPTRKNAQLVEVYIDNGKSIRCTPDHKFLLHNGEYKEAQYLEKGDSLMPHYTKESKKGYELIYNPNNRKYIPSYMMVARYTQEKEWKRRWTKRTIHHKDFNKKNNNPDNLLITENKDHVALHGELTRRNWKDPDFREKQHEARKKAWSEASEKRRQLQSTIMTKYNKGDAHRKSTIKRNKNFWADDLLRKNTSANMRKPKSTTENMKIYFDETFWQFIEEGCNYAQTQNQLVDWLNSNNNFISHFSTLTPRKSNSIHRHLLQKAFQQKGYNNFEEYYYDTIDDNKLVYEDVEEYIEKGYSQKNIGNIFGVSRSKIRNLQRKNHKVDKVVWLDQKEDTGCITVGEYHNFASSGIIVKNSINDDFFLPKRPDGTGVTIDTLQGGQQLGEIDDVRYFKEKILHTMRIPMAYLTGEMSGDLAKTSLSAMDVRFAKTIERIQKMIVKGLEKIAIIELAFKRFRIDDIYNFSLMLTPPSKIYEMQELEMLSQKLGIIQSAIAIVDETGRPYFPREWLYKNVNKFNDQEIATLKLMQQAEMAQKQEDEKRKEMAQSSDEMPGAEAGMAGGGEFPAAEPGAPEGGEEFDVGDLDAEAPAEPEAPEGGEEADMQVASQILKVAGREFLLENENNIKEIFNFIKEQRENAQITKDNSKDKKRKKKLYENSFDMLFIKGEFKGLIRRKRNDILKD